MTDSKKTILFASSKTKPIKKAMKKKEKDIYIFKKTGYPLRTYRSFNVWCAFFYRNLHPVSFKPCLTYQKRTAAINWQLFVQFKILTQPII